VKLVYQQQVVVVFLRRRHFGWVEKYFNNTVDFDLIHFFTRFDFYTLKDKYNTIVQSHKNISFFGSCEQPWKGIKGVSVSWAFFLTKCSHLLVSSFKLAWKFVMFWKKGVGWIWSKRVKLYTFFRAFKKVNLFWLNLDLTDFGIALVSIGTCYVHVNIWYGLIYCTVQYKYERIWFFVCCTATKIGLLLLPTHVLLFCTYVCMYVLSKFIYCLIIHIIIIIIMISIYRYSLHMYFMEAFVYFSLCKIFSCVWYFGWKLNTKWVSNVQ